MICGADLQVCQDAPAARVVMKTKLEGGQSARSRGPGSIRRRSPSLCTGVSAIARGRSLSREQLNGARSEYYRNPAICKNFEQE
jgi:hypothetical protein